MSSRDNMRNATLFFGDLFFVVWGFWGGILLYGVWDMLEWNNAVFYTAVIVVLYNIAFFTLKYYKDSINFFDYFAVARLGLSVFFIYSVLALVMTLRGFFVEIRVIAGCFIVSCFLCGFLPHPADYCAEPASPILKGVQEKGYFQYHRLRSGRRRPVSRKHADL